MRAAVVQEFKQPLEITDVSRPSAADHGVVVDIEASGICRSDWHHWQGHLGDGCLGGILGHEPAGTVVKVGKDVESVREGDQVTVPFNIADGTCPTCRKGHTHRCEQGISPTTHSDYGAWAEEMAAPWADINAVRLPDGVSAKEMAGLGCRFMTSFHALSHRADVAGGDWVAIHGCGGVGLSAVNIATALGGNVVAIDLHDEKLDMAEDLGAEMAVNAREVDDVSKEIIDITSGGADISVDALGSKETIRNSIDCLDQFGQHVQVGVTSMDDGGVVPLPTFQMLINEIDFIGSVGMPPTRYDEIFNMVENGRVNPESVITREVALDDVNDRLEAMTDYQTVGMEIITQF